MGKFITDQILGMKWLNTLIGNLLGTLGLDVTSRIGGSIQFFLYDVIKITVLLCVLIYLYRWLGDVYKSQPTFRVIFRRNAVRKLWGGFTVSGQTASQPCSAR